MGPLEWLLHCTKHRSTTIVIQNREPKCSQFLIWLAFPSDASFMGPGTLANSVRWLFTMQTDRIAHATCASTLPKS